MAKSIWSLEEIEILKSNYEYTKTHQLIEMLNNKTNDQIRWKAKTYKLHKKVSTSTQNMNFFENIENPLNCYWWGFFTADGCFNEKSFIISIDYSDINHLEKLAKLLNANIQKVNQINSWNPNGHTMARIALEDIFTISRLRQRFKLLSQKTYNPFNIEEFLTQDKILYFLAGIIDGDGYITKMGNSIKIKCHKNWYDNFKLIQNKIKDNFNIDSTLYICSKGWTNFGINKQKHCKIFKKLIQNSIPLLTRKWDRIILE